MKIFKLRAALFLMKFSTLWFGGWTFMLVCCFGWAENPYPFFMLIFATVGAGFCTMCAASGIPEAEYRLELALDERSRVPVKKIDRR